MKKKLDDLTKLKLIYSGELIIISIVFLVISSLEFANVITISQRHHEIFNWVTIFGGAWIIFDLIWMLRSKKRREKGCLLDKLTVLPLAIYVIVFDIIAFVNYNKMPQEFYQYCIPAALMYGALVFIFQGIYHWYHPLPELLEELEEDKKKKEQEAQENKTEEKNKED